MGKRKGGEIPLLAIERIIKLSGANRASYEAKLKLREILEEIGYNISVKAIKIAEHSKRITIRAEDIKLVIEDK